MTLVVVSSKGAHLHHARLEPTRLAWLFESLPLVGLNCGADMRIIAFVT